jgi:hypothetical protein
MSEIASDRSVRGEGGPYRLIGRGLYTIPEASRLAKVPIANIRRWVLGYSYRTGGEQRWCPRS